VCQIGLSFLLSGRVLLYWLVGPEVHWIPSLRFGVIALPFNSVSFWRMVLFSLGSFGFTLGVFYLWLLLLSAVNRRAVEPDPFQKFVRLQLGWLEKLPAALKLVGPWALLACLWCAASPGLTRLNLVEPPKSAAHLCEQGLVLGAAALLMWKYLIVGLLALHLANSYLYLGIHPFWSFVSNTARRLLWPVAWLPLRLGRFDFVPLAAIVLVLVGAAWLERCLANLYTRLPL
jgi:hypothetical protein